MRLIFLCLAECVLALSCAAQVSVTPAFQVSVTPAPIDNESTVTVSFTAFPADATAKLYNQIGATAEAACNAAVANLVALKKGVPATAVAGSTLLTLVTDKPLNEGAPICVEMTPRGGTPVLSKVVVVGAPAGIPGFDWGLVRAYFTAGALTSQERDQFSHQDLFLAFRLDKVYGTSKLVNKAGGYTPHLETFFETRLTALPVAVQTCNATSTASSATSSSGSCSSSTSASTGTTSGSGSGSGSSTPATTTQTYLNSQKTARLQFGIDYPFYFPGWKVATRKNGVADYDRYALFVAPMVETGFDSSLNGLNQTQQQSSAASQVQPIGNSRQFYKFYEFGFRLGHDQLSTDRSKAPSQISYLDVGWGRFSNLASLLCPANQFQGNNTCGVASGTLPWQRDWRMRVEGLLEVPATKGFSIGFSTNVSFYHTGPATGTAPVHIRPSDDLRFLFAYKFDISKIAAKLAQQNF